MSAPLPKATVRPSVADQPNHSAIPKPTVAVGANVMAGFFARLFRRRHPTRKRSIRSADNQMMNPRAGGLLGSSAGRHQHQLLATTGGTKDDGRTLLERTGALGELNDQKPDAPRYRTNSARNVVRDASRFFLSITPDLHRVRAVTIGHGVHTPTFKPIRAGPGRSRPGSGARGRLAGYHPCSM